MLGAARIRTSAGPHAREDCSGKLAAGNKAHQECAKTKFLMHMQRQDRHRDPDDKECDENRRHNRQQRRARPRLAEPDASPVILVTFALVHSPSRLALVPGFTLCGVAEALWRGARLAAADMCHIERRQRVLDSKMRKHL